MAISCHSASAVVRAYARPKVSAVRSNVNGPAPGQQAIPDNRREAPDVQLRLSSEALAILAQAQKGNPPKADGTLKVQASKEADQSELFPEDIFGEDGEANARRSEGRNLASAEARQAYAPPGSKINIVL